MALPAAAVFLSVKAQFAPFISDCPLPQATAVTLNGMKRRVDAAFSTGRYLMGCQPCSVRALSLPCSTA